MCLRKWQKDGEHSLFNIQYVVKQIKSQIDYQQQFALSVLFITQFQCLDSTMVHFIRSIKVICVLGMCNGNKWVTGFGVK